MDTVERLLTVKEAATLLQVTEAAVRKWVYQRRIPCVKLGRLTRLRREEVEAVMAKGLPALRLG
jgi:excisionase family DNA binding protein